MVTSTRQDADVVAPTGDKPALYERVELALFQSQLWLAPGESVPENQDDWVPIPEPAAAAAARASSDTGDVAGAWSGLAACVAASGESSSAAEAVRMLSSVVRMGDSFERLNWHRLVRHVRSLSTGEGRHIGDGPHT
ncbi:MAG: hypothetical protein ACR2JK_11935 [Geodermatophilaceae bacterium]